MVEEELLTTYMHLRAQARKALLADSTVQAIANNRREEKRTKYLYLHTAVYSISSFPPRRQGMLEVELPHAGDSNPLYRLATRLDNRLTGWLKVTAVEQGMAQGSVIREAASSTCSLREELFGTLHDAAV
jgi:hypothetical protein